MTWNRCLLAVVPIAVLCACADDDSGDDDDIGEGEGEGEGECEGEGVGYWRPMSLEGAPPIHDGADVVWTGDELIVLGGISEELYSERIGAIYNPSTDSWRPMPTGFVASPSNAIDDVTSVWTGTEMLVWEQRYPLDGDPIPWECTGGRYSPAEDVWRSISLVDAPLQQCAAVSGWTGTEWLLWAGPTGGRRYDPATDDWSPMATEGGPAGVAHYFGGWTDAGLVVSVPELGSGAVYHPESDSWTPMSQEGAPALELARPFGRIWGNELFLIYEDGGRRGPPAATRYDPSRDEWTALAPPPSIQLLFPAGDSLLTYFDAAGAALYDPVADEWTPICTTGAPPELSRIWLRWTGTEMLLIGSDFWTDEHLAARFRF